MKHKKRVLIADPSSTLTQAILKAPEASLYQIEIADTGSAAFHKIKEFEPDLVVVDLMIPHIHGIEILKTLKSNELTQSIGVIVSSYHVMIQNYKAAIDAGANYFLVKPFEVDFLFQLIKRFFAKDLQPDPFNLKAGHQINQILCYHPIPSTVTSYIRFWGTRGSNPVAGAEYVRYGGNTSCLEVRRGDNTLIIDAGTGIRALGDAIDIGEDQTIHLFISHTHWDHITGFPFFNALYKKNCNVIVWAPVGFEKSTKELFTNMLAYAYFPVRLDEMRAKIIFKELRDDRPVSIGDIIIDCHFTNHPGPTVGFKLSTPDRSIGYITDNEMLLGYHGHPNDIDRHHPLLEPHLSLIKFLSDCNLIIHEAQYFPEEYYRKIGWGHSSIPNATVLIKYTGCKKWVITHHDPNHKDKDLQTKARLHEDILKECKLDIHTEIAYDGLLIPL
ncbi:MAG: response regulator [Simkania negevensis]|nr:response regulator [Simkania negevensis]